jgi:hypothetical protein
LLYNISIVDDSDDIGCNPTTTQRNAPIGKRRRVRGGASGASLTHSTRDTPTFTSAKVDIDDVDFSSNTMTKGSQEPNPDNGNEGGLDNNVTMTSIIDSISVSKNINSNATTINTEDDKAIPLVEEQRLLIIRPVSGSADDRLLQDLQPSHIIIYDPNPMLIRQVEVSRSL